MRILDKYILKRFITTLVFALISFILIVIFVDMVGNLAKFIDKNVPKLIIFKFYFMYIPSIFALVLPIAMLLASMFSIGHLAKYNELVSIKSAGISLHRILLPVFIFSILISVSALGFNENIAAKANQKKTDIEDKYLDPYKKISKVSYSNIFLHDTSGRRIFIGRFDSKTKIANKVTIQTYAANQITERLDAESMQWQDTTWVLKTGYKRNFQNGQEHATAFKDLADKNLTFTPKQLLENQAEPEDMSYSELNNFVQEVRKNGGNPTQWLVGLNFKLATPFASFILVLFGAPLAANKKRSGAIFGLTISVMIYLLYFGFNRFVQTLGEVGACAPLFSAWITNLVFLVAGLLSLFFIHK